MRLVAGLPPDLSAAVLVVLHMPPDAASALPAILTRAGPLPAQHPQDGQAFEAGRIYVAPPNRHLLVREAHVELTVGPRENGVRPAVDVLFRSAARAHGPRVVGVVLSGTLRDGTLGLTAIRLRGGIAIVQDPDDALFGGMPTSAMERDHVDYCLPVSEIAAVLARLAREPARSPEPEPDTASGKEPEMSAGNGPTAYELNGSDARSGSAKRPGRASGLSCPDCLGSLWELRHGDLVRLECRVGHAYSMDGFLSTQAERIEDAMWTAVNTLQERAAMLREQVARQGPESALTARFQERAAELDEQSRAVRELLFRFVRGAGSA